MAFFTLRFDFRNPPFADTSMADRYAAALEMAEWGERLGFVQVGLSEHHGSDDGYIPSPLMMAAAFAARTSTIRIGINAMVPSFHNPLRLAEDIAVVDLISNGRLDVTLTNGYVASEFAMFGVDRRERVKRTTEAVKTLRAAWTGEPFEFEGRQARITPAPAQPGGPKITMGGSVEASARRAARIGDGYMPSSPELWAFYRDEMLKLGKPDPGPGYSGDTSFFHVAKDVDKGWDAIAPYAMHEVNAYGATMLEAGVAETGGYQMVEDADTLRGTGQYRVITPEQMVTELKAQGDFALAIFHPMMGGIPPALAWESLELFEREVLPNL